MSTCCNLAFSFGGCFMMEKETENRISDVARRFLCWLLAVACILSGLPYSSAPVKAAETKLPAYKMTFSGVTGADQVTPGQPAYMLKNSGTAVYNLNLKPGYTSGESQGMLITLASPFLVYDEAGNLNTTYEIPEDYTAADRSIRTLVRDMPSSNWYGVGTENTVIYTQSGEIMEPPDGASSWKGVPLNEYQPFTFSGIVDIQMVKAASIWHGTTDAVVQLESKYFGDVPENASASVEAGMSYTTYRDAFGNVTSGYQKIEVGGNPDSEQGNYNSIAFINSNLNWTASIEALTHPPMWDQYNYMTYKIVVQNISEKAESYLDGYDINFTVQSSTVNGGVHGVLQADMMAWRYDPVTGELTKNTEFDLEAREYPYSGKPGEGGVLCWDVTDIPAEELAEWDLETFSNIKEPLIPYYYPTAGTINIPREHEALYSPHDTTPGHISQKVYYIAIPYPNNFESDLNNLSVLRPTIFFGGKGYSWSQQFNNNTPFDQRKITVEQRKYVQNDSGAQVSSIEAGVGELSSYFLEGFANKGNVPIFDSYALDTLPQHFRLEEIKIYLGEEEELEDWFCEGEEGRNLLELEVEGKGGTLSWVPCGTRQGVEEEADGSRSYTITMQEEMEAYLEANKGTSFTGRIRWNFKHRIGPGKSFDGRIEVKGYPMQAIKYENQLQINYQQWTYYESLVELGGNPGYQKKDASSRVSKATINAKPTKPGIVTKSIRYGKDGPEEIDNDIVQVPLNENNAAYRFVMTNDSASKMIPALLSTQGDFLSLDSKGKWGGFRARELRINAAAVEKSLINSITFIDASGAEWVLPKESIDAYQQDGDIVLTDDVWVGTDPKNPQIPDLQGIKVSFSYFESDVTVEDDCWVEVRGVPSFAESRTVTGIWQTDYDPELNVPNQTARDAAALTAKAINPVITGDIFYQEGDGVEKTGTVPYRAEDAWYRFVIENRSPSAADDTNLEFTMDSLENKAAAGEAASLRGFKAKEIIISGNWDEAVIPTALWIYNWDQEPYGTEPPKASISWDDVKKQYMDAATKEVRIPVSAFPQIEGVRQVRLVCSHLNGNIYAKGQSEEDPEQDNALRVEIHGTPDWHGELEATGGLLPQHYLYASFGKTQKVIMEVADFEPKVTASTHWVRDGVQQNGGSASPHTLETMNDEEVWYGFQLENTSISPAGPCYADLDLLSVADRCTKKTAVQGFKSEEIVIGADTEKACEIKSLELYNWDAMDGAKPDKPSRVFTAEELEAYRQPDKSLRIPLSAVPEITYLRYIRLQFTDFYGTTKADGNSAQIELHGNTDWFDNLDAAAALVQNDADYTENKSASDTGRFHVQRPYLALHSHIQYADVKESAVSDTSMTDKNQTRLGVPYDRDFKMWVNMENGSSPAESGYSYFSVLDDVDATIDLPIKDNAGVRFTDHVSSGSGEAYTGFHVTKLVVKKELLAQYRSIGSIQLTDVDSADAPLALKPVTDAKGTITAFDLEDGTRLSLTDEGLVLDEAQLQELGINHLARVEILGGRYMKVTEEDTRTEQRVEFYGYEDSPLNTTDILNTHSENYLDGIRDEGDLWCVKAKDSTVSYVSKMYFDTVVSAFYNDGATGKFTAEADALEHIRKEWATHSSWNNVPFGDNTELEIGYKGIGSFGIDFRQYLNVGGNLPVGAPNYNTYSSQEHQNYSWVHTQSLNTAATVNLSITVPSQIFDTYYLKVNPNTREYLNWIEVTREDGAVHRIEPSDWVGNAVETDAAGNKYFRINLVKGLGYSDDEAEFWTDAYAYSLDGPENPVTGIVVNMDVNQPGYKDEAETMAADPDYGTWYRENDANTRSAFEVTGRLYKTGKAELTAETTLTIGNKTNGRSKQRTDAGAASGRRVQSSWSYWNKYWGGHVEWGSGLGWHWVRTEYLGTARDMKSSAVMGVVRDNNYVRNGVHSAATSEYDDTNVKFADQNQFAVSFYRGSCFTSGYTSNGGNGAQNLTHDYSQTGNLDDWKEADGYDWAGRVGFSDKVVLSDTLPVIEPNTEFKYYGFLTTGLKLENDVFTHMTSIILELEGYSEVTDAEGNVVSYQADPAKTRTVTLTKDQLGTLNEIFFLYASEGQTEEEAAAVNQIWLEEWQFVKNFKIVTEKWNGNSDYAKEVGRKYSAELSGNASNIDVLIKGKPYVYVNQPGTGLGDSIKHAQNRITPIDYCVYTPNEGRTNPQYNTEYYYTSDGSRPAHAWTDTFETAHMRGYLIPYQAGYSVAAKVGTLNDYQNDNLTPNVEEYVVRAWNRQDGSTEKEHASRLDGVFTTNSLQAAFNMQKLYIPKEFIDGDWFRVNRLLLVGSSNKQMSFTLETLKPLLTPDANGKDYVLDVEKLLHDNLDMVTSYSVTQTDGKARAYDRAHVNSFKLDFKAVAGNREKPETVMQAGQYLSASKTATDYAFRYDGVFVDRSQAVFRGDSYTNWDFDSIPSYGWNSPNGYAVNASITQNLGATFTTIDPNHGTFSELSGTTKAATTRLSNLVGNLRVEVTRTRDTNKFAYDLDDCTIEAPKKEIDGRHVMPWDYIEYLITVGSWAGAGVPQEKTDLRFDMPQGQRICKWEIVSNSTDIADTDMTAYAGEQELNPGTDYSRMADASGEETLTNIKQIVVHLGTEGDAAQIKPGKAVTLRVVTQMTDEFGTAFQGKEIHSYLYAASGTKHGYSQYRINGGKETNNYNLNSVDWHRNHGDAGTLYNTSGNTDGNTDVSYWRNFMDNVALDGRVHQYTCRADSGTYFVTRQSDLSIGFAFGTDALGGFDGQPGKVTVSGIKNYSQHSQNIQETVNFLKPVNGRYLQVFELTGLFETDYPTGLKENTITPRPPIKKEYFVLDEDGMDNPDAYNNYTRTAEDIEKGRWVDAADYEDNPEELEAMLSRVISVRWTYYDIPAGQALNPVVLNGAGRYQDERLGVGTGVQADIFTGLLKVTEVYTHTHTEKEHLGEGAKNTSMSGSAQATPSVRRETPILWFQTQIFDTEEEAAAAYAAGKAQKTGYRPNETFWYKTTLRNLTQAESGGTVQGAMLNPVFYDKVPSQYVDAKALEDAAKGDMSGVHIIWKDKTGADRDMSGIRWEVNRLETVTAKDYGGEMIYTNHADASIYSTVDTNSPGKKLYKDLDPRASGISQDAEYTVYQIRPVSEKGKAVRMEIGDSISFHYAVTAHQDGLPMIMTDQDRSLATDADQSPSYFPRVGEYWTNTVSGQAWPLATGSDSKWINRVLETSDKMMDMDYLIHDVGFSADKNDQCDRYKMFDGTKVYIPGTANNGSAWGNDGRFMDYDIAAGSYMQQARYTPGAGSAGKDSLPGQILYQGASNANRDYFVFVTGPRTAASQNWEQAGEGEKRTPIVWSEARTHLQKAWLNAASQIIPDIERDRSEYLGYGGYTENNAGRRIETGRNLDYSWWIQPGDYYHNRDCWNWYLYDLRWYLYNRYITTLEYQQDYTARLTASNYGDWGVDGVEMLYTFPLGTEPLLDEDGNLQVSGQYLTDINTWGGTIPAENIQAEIIQTPESDRGYQAPKQPQDPLWNTAANANYYQGENLVPYVVKVTVNYPLKRWFNRGSASGYQMRVDIKCHVNTTNADGKWYDRVQMKPVTNAGENYYYYQIYDITQWVGSNRSKNAHFQIHGMDYMSSYAHEHSGWHHWYNYINPVGSPNTLSVNGYNVQCSEVQTGGANGADGQNTGKAYSAYHTADKADLYAATGTRTEMRKPLLRLWTAITDGESADRTGQTAAGYYTDSEGDTAWVNVNVENRYWWHEYGDQEVKHAHSYPKDGGSMGTYMLPVINVLLPEGVVPMAADGKPYTKDNEDNARRPIAWELNQRSAPTVNTVSPATEAEKQLYDADVQYVEIPEYEDGKDTGQTEGRYLVRIEANLNAQGDVAQKDLEAKIRSGALKIYSFKVFTEKLPDLSIKGADGAVIRDTTKDNRYEDIRTYIGSQMEGFKYEWDGGISGNPYNVGVNAGDSQRLDAVSLYQPADSANGNRAFFDSGWAYSETDSFNVEDYAANIRNPLMLTEEQKDFNGSQANTHPDTEDKEKQIADIGLYNRTRMYTRAPRLIAYNTVGFTKTEEGMVYSEYHIGGEGQEEATLPSPYPERDKPLEYSDVLWYGSKVLNQADGLRYTGSVHHAKLAFVFDLPQEVTFWDEDDTYDPDDIVVEYYDARTSETKTVDMAELMDEDSGWNLKVKHKTDYNSLGSGYPGYPEYPNTDKKKQHEAESVVIELSTPADDGYQDYDSLYTGAKPGGYLACGSWVKVRIKTRVDNLGEESTVGTAGDTWLADGCRTYVTIHETDGHFNAGSEGLKEQPQDLVLWVNRAMDQEADEEADEDDEAAKAADYDRDGDYTDLYTTARSAVFRLRKPDGAARIDSIMPRRSIIDPDEQTIVTATDVHIKGATSMQYLLDQAQNKGGAVNRFLVDIALPFHGTATATGEIAPVTGPKVTPEVQAIRTGVWEVPDTLTEEEKKKLESMLKVYVLVRTSTNPHAEDGYLYPDSEEDRAAYGDGSWTLIGDTAGYSLAANTLIADGIPDNVRQVRFVVKAGTGYDDDITPIYYPVPSGFRLAVDADPDTEDVKEEMDDVDPSRLNVNEIPDNVKKNCAFVQAATLSGDPMLAIHSNYFAQCITRYDDTKYSGLGERGRAGIYVDPELPYLGFRMEMGYYTGSGINGYRWNVGSAAILVDPSASKVMKYRTYLVNYSNAQLEQKGYLDPKGKNEEDTITDPNMSIVLPYIQNLQNNLAYVPYSSLQGDDMDYLSDDYRVTGSITNPADNLDYEIPHWTWYVERDKTDAEGNLLQDENGQNIVEIVDNPRVSLKLDGDGNPASPEYVEKIVNLNSSHKRKVVIFHYTGMLMPGERLVVEFMMPLNADRGSAVSQDLMESYGYGFKNGNYTPYIPSNDDGYGSCGYERDSRDLNNNGLAAEMALRRTIKGLSFKEDPALKQVKKVDSQVHSDRDYKSGPASVPEGTDYRFNVSILNQTEAKPEEHKHICMYDVLPYNNDFQIFSGDTSGNPIARDSSWNGWLIPDSIQVKVFDPNKIEQYPDGKILEMTTNTGSPKDYDIWVGPFEQSGNTYKALDVSELPAYKPDTEKGTRGTREVNFYVQLFGNDALKKTYKMVRLIDLIAATKNNPDAYEAAIKGIRSIWMEMEKEDYCIGSYNRIEMSYKMHAPLNIPKYVGDVSGDSSSQFIASLGYCGWNTFVHHAVGAGMTGENSKAGVYLNAPEGRGYIGSYIWHDFNYDAEMNEAEYEDGTNGRPQVSKLTTDLDFDGKADDPGINKVKVELLSEKGYIVNRNGEAIAEVQREGEAVKYALINEDTGEYVRTGTGLIAYTDCGPAASYISESDYFGHKGYYMLSNLLPGDYKLRFTFPESLENYAVTTLKIGDTEAGLEVYRSGDTLPDLGKEGVGDAPGDAMVVDTLVAQTKDAIHVAAVDLDNTTVGADGLTPHQRYDRQMTSYNVGVGRPHTVGGWAWFDEHGPEDAPEIDGRMTDDEKKLGKMRVTLYEYDPDTEELKEALDVDGKPASMLTEIVDKSNPGSAENGKFTFKVRPGWYVAQAENEDKSVVLKPTPYKYNDDPLLEDDDNDLEKSGIYMQTKPFLMEYQLGENGKPLYDEKGQGYAPQYKLAFGLVNAGRGFLGNTIWSDENYNGVREGLEPGIGGVKVTIERYYLDADTNRWMEQEDFTSVKTTTNAGNFVFQEMTTYTPEPDGRACLAGYRLRIDKEDLEALPAHYAVTKYQTVKDTEADSDLKTTPVQTSDGKMAYYLTDGAPVILANEAVEGTDPVYIMSYAGKNYDVTDGASLLDFDGGLKEFENVKVSGVIWDDKDYDGIRKKGEESRDEGIQGVSVILEQYIRSGGSFTKVDERTAQTDGDGRYEFSNVSTYYENPETKNACVAYYRLKLKELPEGYRVTRYHQGKDTAVDSDLAATDLYMTKGTAPVEQNYFAAASVSTIPHNEAYCRDEGNVRYDIVKSSGNVSGYDGGLKGPETGELTGIIWKEKEYDGLYQEDEEGFAGLTVLADQYYMTKEGKWIKEAEDFAQAVTGADGRYLLENLPAHIEKNGKWYLAGYKVTLPRQEKLSGYETTWYHQGKGNETDSDAKGTLDLSKPYELTDWDGKVEREFGVTAKKASSGTNEDKNDAYVYTYAGSEYDILTANRAAGPDVGLKELETANLYGWVWNDKNYDGIRGSDETVDEPIDGQTVYLDQYYLDENGEWVLSKENYASAVTDKGRYEFAAVPAMLEVGNARRLTAYQIRMDAMNQGWTLTKYRQGKDSHKWSDLQPEDEKSPGARQRTAAEEEEGENPGELKIPLTLMEKEEFLPAAVEVKQAYSSYCVMAPDGKIYDMLAAPKEKASGNAGELPYATGSISGWIWEDKNYNGVQDPEEAPIKEKVTVKLERFIYENDTWIKDESFTVQEAQTDSVTGRYLFNKLETHVGDPDDFKIYGYQVRIDMDKCEDAGIFETYAVTKYRAGSNREKDSDWIISDDENSGRLTGEEEYIIVAAEAEENANPINVAEVEGVAYDACQGAERSGWDGGLKRYENASLLGTAWKDVDHDGILDEGEKRIEGLKLVLQQAYYKDGAWNVVPEEEFHQTQTTDADGTYQFEELPPSLYMEGKRYLAGYRLCLDGEDAVIQTVLKQYAVSKYLVEEGSEKDNKLVWEGMRMTWPAKENGGWLLFAEPVSNSFSGNSYNYRRIDGKDYDVAYSEDIGGMNAGFSPYQTTSITGTAWTEDYDEKGTADGIRQETEKRQSGVKVLLEQYYLDGGEWKKADEWISFMSAQPEPESDLDAQEGKPDEGGQMLTETDKNGVYRFDGLPTNGILNETDGAKRRVILGYKVKIPEMPEGFDATWHLTGNGINDSDLNESTSELTPEILVAPKTADPQETEENRLDGYSIVLAENYDGIDAGFLPYRGSLIEGVVWNDKDWNGLQNAEPGMEGHTVYLDVMIEGTDIEEGDTASGLALFAEKEEGEPDKEPPGNTEPDKEPSDGVESGRAAEPEDENPSTEDTEPGKNPDEEPGQKPGTVPEEPEWISPTETDVPGEETDGILQDGVYRAYASCVTDAEGNYRFADVPVLDRKTRRPYRYRLRMEKPSNAYYVPLNAGDDRADNDYAHLNLTGYLTDQAQGITRSFRLGGAAEKENAYGYIYHIGYTTVQDMLDFGLHVLDTETVVAGSVFVDENKDGIRNGEEQGRKAVNVILYRYDPVAQTWKETPDAEGKSRILTGEDGRYMFRVPVADMEKESPNYLTPYRYRVSIMKPKDDASFSVKYPGRQAVNAATLGAGLYDASKDYQTLAKKVNDFNDAVTMEGKEESGLPAAGPQLVISSEFELAEVHRDHYMGRDVVSLDRVHVDIGRGAALLGDGGEGITADMEVWPIPKKQPYAPGTEPLDTETEDPVETVRTGDDTQIGRYLLILAVSGLMIGALLFVKRRKKEKEEES